MEYSEVFLEIEWSEEWWTCYTTSYPPWSALFCFRLELEYGFAIAGRFLYEHLLPVDHGIPGILIPSYYRMKYHTQLAKTSFDGFLDLRFKDFITSILYAFCYIFI